MLAAIWSDSITLGNAITAVTLLLTMAGAWYKLSARVDVVEKLSLENRVLQETLSGVGVPTLCKQHAESLRDMREKLAQLPVVANDVAWIKAAMIKNGHPK